MKKNQGGFVTIVLIVLIVAFTGTAAYFISTKKAEFKRVAQSSQSIETTPITPSHQTTEPTAQPLQQNTSRATPVNETADWKKYQNNKYWFSVKYPADWDVSALPLNCPSDEHPILDEYNQLGFVKGKETRTCLGPDIRGNFIIEISTNYPQKIAFGGKIISSQETVTTIGGMPATMITGILLAGGELNNGFAFTSIIVKKDDYYFLINDSSGKMEGVADTEYKAIFEKFLSTFEFSK